uniref:Uncharacterized protein n=1 Tax=Paramormyrops kingsleyae TaxID=1676925 RepID=A0A3B3R1G3_9TELE
VPGADTCHLPQALVSLPGQLFGASHTFNAMTFGDPNNVDHLVLREDAGDRYRPLQPLTGPVHLLRDGATVQLHLHDVGLLLLQGQKPHLRAERVRSVLLHHGEILLQLLLAGFILTSPLPPIKLASLLIPVLVEVPSALITDVLGEDGLEGAEATDGVDVSHNPHNHHGRSNCVLTEANTVHLPQGVGHASLVAQEGGEMHGLPGVILGPAVHFAPVPPAAFPRQEAKVSVTGSVELPVRLWETCPGDITPAPR